MTQKSEQLIKRLTQTTEWIIESDMPISEKLKVKDIIHEATQALKAEVPNMSEAEKINAVFQLQLLISIIVSSLKEQGIFL
jgi:dephospho-CoA kinase